jgi:integrase
MVGTTNGQATALLEDWQIDMTIQRREETTISERVRFIGKFHKDTGVQPAHAQVIHIKRWIAQHPEWSKATVATYMTHLRAWFKWLQLQDHRADDPMIKIGAVRHPERDPRPVSSDGLSRLLTDCRMWPTTRAKVLLAACQGLRVAEIAKIRGEDIVDSRFLVVNGKGNRTKTLPLHPLIAKLSKTMPIQGFWFPSPKGGHVDSKSVSQVISLAMRRAKVKGTPHSLRHWYGTELSDRGADLAVVQDLMRHKSPNTTRGYTLIADKRKRQAILSLDPYNAAREAKTSA